VLDVLLTLAYLAVTETEA